MNLGAFAVIAGLQKRTGVTSSLGTFAGLGRREPVMGILMTLFLLSLTGIPPTAGFFAKANVILAAVEAGGPLTILAVITVLNAAVAAFYYLRVVVYMFMRDGASDAPALRHGGLLWSGLAAATALTVLLGLFPTACSKRPAWPRRRSSPRRARRPVPSGRRPYEQWSGLAFGCASACGAASCDSGSALRSSFGWVPTTLRGLQPERLARRRERLGEDVVERRMAVDVGDDIQEALVVARPDLDDHADHLLAVRHLRRRQERQEHPGPGMGEQVDGLALAGLAEPVIEVVHRDVAGRIADRRLDDRQVDLERRDPDPRRDPVARSRAAASGRQSRGAAG